MWTNILSTTLELQISVLVLISTSDVVYILSLTMLAMLYHKIDHPSPFVKMLTHQNPNLSCNLQWEIYYLTVFFYLPWNWRACLIGDNDHKRKDFQYSWKHARNQIPHPILFLQKNFLLKILCDFYKQSIIFGAILQNKKIIQIICLFFLNWFLNQWQISIEGSHMPGKARHSKWKWQHPAAEQIKL